MKVYILRKTDNEPKAIVMVNLVKNVTVEGIGGGTWENSTIETGWMWLEEFTPEGGYFCSVTTGMRDIAPNIDGWLSNLIEDIEMVKTD